MAMASGGGIQAARALRRLAPARHASLAPTFFARPACRAAATAASHRTLASPYAVPASPRRHPLRHHAGPGVSCRRRRSIFNLAAAALGQAAGSGGGPQQQITTVRTLPYAASDLFHIIADVDAYEKFLPHCTSSRVTRWRTSPAACGTQPVQRLAARADLTVGWGPLTQTYSSRVYCVPGHGVVEAVSGRAGAPTLTAAERAEIGLDKTEDEAGRRLGAETATDDDTFESLVTRWTVSALPPRSAGETPRTQVELRIRYQFRNPLYQIATAQISKEMATKMVDAFEKRAASLLRPKTL